MFKKSPTNNTGLQANWGLKTRASSPSVQHEWISHCFSPLHRIKSWTAAQRGLLKSWMHNFDHVYSKVDSINTENIRNNYSVLKDKPVEVSIVGAHFSLKQERHWNETKTKNRTHVYKSVLFCTMSSGLMRSFSTLEHMPEVFWIRSVALPFHICSRLHIYKRFCDAWRKTPGTSCPGWS